jgi:hypothetical protein
MPKRIALPEIFLHIFNPLLLIVVGVLTVLVGVEYPFLGLALIVLICAVFVVKKTRTTAFELIQNNLILLISLSSFVGNRKFKLWKPIPESRFGLNEQVLREKKLI